MTTAVALQFQAANVSRDVTHVLARSGQGTAAQQARQVTLQRQNQDTPKSSQFRMFAVYKSKDGVLHRRDGACFLAQDLRHSEVCCPQHKLRLSRAGATRTLANAAAKRGGYA